MSQIYRVLRAVCFTLVKIRHPLSLWNRERRPTTAPFTTIEPQTPEIREFYVVRKCLAMAFGAKKLVKKSVRGFVH